MKSLTIFDEGLGPRCQWHLYSVVLEFFLCYSTLCSLACHQDALHSIIFVSPLKYNIINYNPDSNTCAQTYKLRAL